MPMSMSKLCLAPKRAAAAGLMLLLSVGAAAQTASPMPTREQVDKMAPAEREATQKRVLEAAAKQPDTMVKQAMPAAPMSKVRSGKFRNSDLLHRGSGTATLYKRADGSHFLRLETFKVTAGPDLYVYLSKHPDPDSSKQMRDAGFVSIAKLKGNAGDQNYELPKDVKLDDFKSVVIYCQLFGVLFSPAALK
jgi:Electron transfer DM13